MTDDVEKLLKLLDHWKGHNTEHAENYKLWAQKMALLGKTELSKVLYELYNQSLKLNELFDRAAKIND